MYARDAVREYLKRAAREAVRIEAEPVEAVLKGVFCCIENGGKVLICGNGGSASDASHLAGELVGRFRRDRKPFPAVALTVDPAVVTALGNDYGYDRVFERQVEALGKPADVLLAISTSGRSANVVKACEKACEMGMTVILFTAHTDSSPPWAHLHWKATCPETSHAQEQMLTVFHALCQGLESMLED